MSDIGGIEVKTLSDIFEQGEAANSPASFALPGARFDPPSLPAPGTFPAELWRGYEQWLDEREAKHD